MHRRRGGRRNQPRNGGFCGGGFPSWHLFVGCRSAEVRNDPSFHHRHHVFPLRYHGYHGGQHPRHRLFGDADACLLNGRLRPQDPLDLYDFPVAPHADDALYFLSCHMDRHGRGPLHLLYDCAEAASEGRLLKRKEGVPKL